MKVVNRDDMMMRQLKKQIEDHNFAMYDLLHGM